MQQSIRLRLLYRHYLRHPWQFGLSVIGIALGVAVVFAIDLTNSSAKRGFELANQAIAGHVTHQIFPRGQTLDEALYRNLRVVHGFTGLSPVVSGKLSVPVQGDGSLQFDLVGIDPLALMTSGQDYGAGRMAPAMMNNATPLVESPDQLISVPAAIIMLRSSADRLGIDEHARLDVIVDAARHTLNVISVVEELDTTRTQALQFTLIADISTAQDVLGLHGQLSRIDASLSNVQARLLRRILPATVTLEQTGVRGNAMQQMTAAFQTNLTALSLLALLIGAFLIYNTMTLAVLQRRATIATLRTLGLSRNELFFLLMAEGLGLGIIGTFLGLLLGWGLSHTLLGLVATTLNDLYFATSVQEVAIMPWVVFKAIALGVGATACAALLPALETTRVPPVIALSRSALEIRTRQFVPRLVLGGLLLIALALAILAFSARSISVGFGGLFLLVAGFALLTPAALVLLINAARPVMQKMFGLLGAMASRSVLASLSRTQVAVAALAIAISATIGVALMIGSFRLAVEQWLNDYLSADVYISQERNSSQAGIAAQTIDQIMRQSGVRTVATFRSRQLWRGEKLTRLYIRSLPERVFDKLVFTQDSSKNRWQKFRYSDSVIVSEAYAWRHRLQPGDNVTLATAEGDKPFEIAGIHTDYSADQGIVTMHEATYLRHWPHDLPSGLHIYLTQGADANAVLTLLRQDILAGTNLQARANRSIREAALTIFDRSFAVTEVLRVLTVIIAFVGIFSALMAMQLERGREFAVLRANGLTPRQLIQLLLAEGGLMGLAAGLLAMPLGVILAYVLIVVINQRSFGWSMQFVFEPRYLLAGLVLGLLAGLCASLYPAWRMASTSPAAALRNE